MQKIGFNSLWMEYTVLSRKSLNVLVGTFIACFLNVAKSDYQLCHVVVCIYPFVCLSVRIEQLGSHWSDFHEVWYLWFLLEVSRENRSFVKLITRIQLGSHWPDFHEVWDLWIFLEVSRENRSFIKLITLIHMYIYIVVSCWILLRMRNVLGKEILQRNSKDTFYVQ